MALCSRHQIALLAASLAATFLFPSTSHDAQAASMDRAVYFWDKFVPNPSDPLDFASSLVVTDPVKQSKVLNTLNTQNNKRAFISYAPGNFPTGSETATWNQKLSDAGVEPIFLLGSLEVSPAAQLAYINFIQTEMINYNQFGGGRPIGEQYQGVHLDIEPQALPQFAGGDSSLPAAIDRRDLLWELHDTFLAIRTSLDANGAANLPMDAFLPVWFDDVSGFIGWGEGTVLTAVQERDKWFDDVSNVLDGITIAPFGQTTLSAITNSVDWEMNQNFSGNMDVRIALEASIGPGKTWANDAAFWSMVNQVEDHYLGNPVTNPHGHSVGVDIQALSEVMITVIPGDFDLDDDVDAADLALWQASFGVDAGADADGDGDSDGADFLIWQQQFTSLGPAVAAAKVPEPGTAVLLALAFLGFGPRRR